MHRLFCIILFLFCFSLLSQYRPIKAMSVSPGAWRQSLFGASPGAGSLTWSGVFYLHTLPALPQPEVSIKASALCL